MNEILDVITRGNIEAKVFKYSLNMNKFQVIEMPARSEILCTNSQGEHANLWALTTKFNPEKRYFRTARTGHPINHDIIKYIGTCFLMDGSCILHVFEISQTVFEKETGVDA